MLCVREVLGEERTASMESWRLEGAGAIPGAEGLLPWLETREVGEKKGVEYFPLQVSK